MKVARFVQQENRKRQRCTLVRVKLKENGSTCWPQQVCVTQRAAKPRALGGAWPIFISDKCYSHDKCEAEESKVGTGDLAGSIVCQNWGHMLLQKAVGKHKSKTLSHYSLSDLMAMWREKLEADIPLLEQLNSSRIVLVQPWLTVYFPALCLWNLCIVTCGYFGLFYVATLTRRSFMFPERIFIFYRKVRSTHFTSFSLIPPLPFPPVHKQFGRGLKPPWDTISNLPASVSFASLHTRTLDTLHFTLPLYTLHSTLCTLNLKLHTLHPTLQALHSTLYTLHLTLRTLHFTLCILHFTLYTSHSALYAVHSTL